MTLWSSVHIRAKMLHRGMSTSWIFNTQQVATRRNGVAKQCCDRLAGVKKNTPNTKSAW